MTRRPLVERIILAIAALTAGTGLVQILVGRWLLGILGAEQTPTSVHFFAIVGMFMIVVGGLTVQALLGPDRDSAVFFWGGVQKFGAAAAVSLGIGDRIFSTLAWLVAGTDFASGVLYFAYWRGLRRSPPMATGR